MENGLNVGHIVKFKKQFENIKKGVKAYVYRVEPDMRFAHMNAAYLVTPEGHMLDRMNVVTQNEFLMFVGDSGMRNEYSGKLDLQIDLTKGIFKEAFDKFNH